jgi:putative peptidoglycan lipid II flippase
LAAQLVTVGLAGSIQRSSTAMALGTIGSRLTGFVRNALLAAALGSALFADAFNVANTIPNILYILLLGGALNAVFVPQLVRAMKQDEDGGLAYTNRLLTAAGVLLLVITVAATAAAPLVVDLYTDFTGSQRALTIALARYCLPQIFFYGLFTIVGQILNARGRFGPMMWAPIVNNLAVIGVAASYLGFTADARSAEDIGSQATLLLGLGSTLGVIMQSVILIPFLRGAGYRWTPRFDWRGAGLGKAAQLAGWTVMVVLVNQVGYWVVIQLSTKVSQLADQQHIGYGVGYSAYTNAHLLWMIPQGVVTVSLLTAMLPRLSRQVADGALANMRTDLGQALRVSGTFIVPAAFVFVALGPQIATVVFRYGNVSDGDALVMGQMLSAFALGLIPFSAQYLLVRVFYAFEDTRTPVVIAIWITGIHALLSVICFAVLPVRWVVTGMAGSYGIAYAVGLWITVRKLRGRLGQLDVRGLRRTYTRLIGASAVAAAATFGIARALTKAIGTGFPGPAVTLLGGGMVFLACFLVLARPFRTEKELMT